MKRPRKHIITATMIITAAFLLAAALTVGAQSTNVSGNWKLTFETPNGPAKPTLVLKQDGKKLTGAYKNRRGEWPLEGAVKGKEIEFIVRFNTSPIPDYTLEFAGTVEGGAMKGKVTQGGAGATDFSAKKE